MWRCVSPYEGLGDVAFCGMWNGCCVSGVAWRETFAVGALLANLSPIGVLRGIDATERFGDFLLLFCGAVAFVDADELVALVFGKYLWKHAHGLVFACLLEQGHGFRDAGASALYVFAHHVESLPVVRVLHFSEGFHAVVEQVCDDGVAILAAVECFPAFGLQALCVGHDALCCGEHFCASERRHAVHVEAEHKIDIVANDGGEVVVDDVGAEFELVVLLVVEVELGVVEGESGGGVVRTVDGARGLHHEGALKGVGVGGVLFYGDVERAADAFAGFELHGCPLPLVDELRE